MTILSMAGIGFVSRKRLICLVMTSIIAIGILGIYRLQVMEMYEYMGYQAFNIDLEYLCCVIFSVFLVGITIPKKTTMPSDLFSLIFCIFVLLPYIVLYPIGRPVAWPIFLVTLSILLLPVWMVRGARLLIQPLRIKGLLDSALLIKLLVVVSLLGTFYALQYAPSSSGFDLETSYDRRIEGRQIFLEGGVFAYINAMVINGFIPFIAFWGAKNRKYWLPLLSFGLALVFFFLLGVKAPVFYILLASILGQRSEVGALEKFQREFTYLILAGFAVALIEFYISGLSLVIDYFHRRVFTVPPYVLSGYFDLMFSDTSSGWTLMSGLNPVEGITYLVGQNYFGNPNTNANTNTFVHQIAQGGILNYVLTMLLVVGFFVFIDAIFLSRRDDVFVYVGFIYALLICEQSATTALVSSGIGVVTLFAVLARDGSKKYCYKVFETPSDPVLMK